MNKNIKSEFRGTSLFGSALIGIFLVGGVAWAVQAPLGGAVIASGTIGFEGKRKTVQHLEGGMIRQIHVNEGDHVTAGATILELDQTIAKSRADELRNRIRTLAGEEARLRAERARQDMIVFNHPLLEPRTDIEVSAILDQQVSLFQARQNSLRTRRDILSKRIDQLRKQIEGLEIQLTGVQEQLRLVAEEAATVTTLLKKGYAKKPRLLAIQRAQAQLTGDQGELISSIARTEETIGETRISIANLETNFLEKIDERLTKVQAERVSSEKFYNETMDRLSRTRVLSPVDGVILNVRFKTIGGVIRSGEPIVDIAPVTDELIVSARIKPVDIDEVKVGDPATVMLVAYQQRYLKRIEARVVHVSADAFEDQQTGAPYFKVDVRIDKEHLQANMPDIELAAGMPAEVFIVTGDRTFADYILSPIKRSFERAFKES